MHYLLYNLQESIPLVDESRHLVESPPERRGLLAQDAGTHQPEECFPADYKVSNAFLEIRNSFLEIRNSSL
jgi:hypothetical protein